MSSRYLEIWISPAQIYYKNSPSCRIVLVPDPPENLLKAFRSLKSKGVLVKRLAKPCLRCKEVFKAILEEIPTFLRPRYRLFLILFYIFTQFSTLFSLGGGVVFLFNKCSD